MVEKINTPAPIRTSAFVPTAELEYLQALAEGLTRAGLGDFNLAVPKEQAASVVNQTQVIISTPSGSSDLFEGPRQAISELFKPGRKTPAPEEVYALITSRLRAMQEERIMPNGRPYARPRPYR
jgi:hypothetical protein